MHARVITHSVRGDNLHRVIRIIRERILPAAERQPGFVAFVVMSQPEEGHVVTTSYWTTEEDMLASERAYYLQEQISRLIVFLSAPPLIDHYEVDVMS